MAHYDGDIVIVRGYLTRFVRFHRADVCQKRIGFRFPKVYCFLRLILRFFCLSFGNFKTRLSLFLG